MPKFSYGKFILLLNDIFNNNILQLFNMSLNIDHFSFKNSNIVIEVIILKRKNYFP